MVRHTRLVAPSTRFGKKLVLLHASNLIDAQEKYGRLWTRHTRNARRVRCGGVGLPPKPHTIHVQVSELDHMLADQYGFSDRDGS